MPAWTGSKVDETTLSWLESLGWDARKFLGESVMADTLPQELVNGEIQIKDAGFFLKELGK